MLKNRSVKKSIPLVDYLLIVGFIVSPMTGLRIWKVGPGEIFCLIYAIYGLVKYGIVYKPYKLIINFWIIWLLSMSIGTLVGIVNFPAQTQPVQLSTYLYLFIIMLGIFSILGNRNVIQIDLLLKTLFIFGGMFYIGIFLYSTTISRTLFGVPLWYGGIRFSAGGTNPHQFALMGGILTLLGVRMIFIIGKNFTKLFYLIITVLMFIISNQTLSATLVASYVVVFLVGCILFILQNNSPRGRIVLVLLLLIIVILIFILLFDNIYSFIYNWIASDPNGIGRFLIWQNIVSDFQKSPLIGLGPGNHSPVSTVAQNFMEYHNSYIEVIAMSGIIGFVNLIVLMLLCFKKFFKYPTIAMVFSLQFVYAVSGFALRRLPFWIILTIIYSYVIKQQLKFEKEVIYE